MKFADVALALFLIAFAMTALWGQAHVVAAVFALVAAILLLAQK